MGYMLCLEIDKDWYLNFHLDFRGGHIYSPSGMLEGAPSKEGIGHERVKVF